MLLGEEQFAWLVQELKTDSSPLICHTGINALHTIWGGRTSEGKIDQLLERDRVSADYAGWVKAGADRIIDLISATRGGRPKFTDEYSPPWLHGFDRVFATESKTPTFDPMMKPKNGDTSTWWDVITDIKNAEPYGTAYWTESGRKAEDNLRGDDTCVIMLARCPFGLISLSCPLNNKSDVLRNVLI